MPQLILLICMFIGASADSTGGDIKVIRVLLLFKYCWCMLLGRLEIYTVIIPFDPEFWRK